MAQTFTRRTNINKKVICQSCEEDISETNTNVVDFGCIHNFCKCCVKAVFTHQIREGRLNQLKCLNSRCYIVACKALVQSIVNEETFGLYTNLVLTGTVTGSTGKSQAASKKEESSSESTNFKFNELLADKLRLHSAVRPSDFENQAQDERAITGTNDAVLSSGRRRPELSQNTEQTNRSTANDADMVSDVSNEQALFKRFMAFLANQKIGSKASSSGLTELSETQTKTSTAREFSDQGQHQHKSSQSQNRTLTPDPASGLSDLTNPACPKCKTNAIFEPEQFYGFCEECDFTFCTNCKQPYHGFEGGCLEASNSEMSGEAMLEQLRPNGATQTASEFDCTICMSTIEVSVGIDFGCGHKFCSDCIKSYFETKINDRVTYGYTCPAPKCEVEAHHSMIRRLLDTTGFQKYDEILLDEAIARDMPEIVTCPNVNCQKRVYADEFGYCEACDYRFCTECSKAYHGVSPCGQTEEERRAEILNSTAAEGVAHGIRNNAANYELPPPPLGFFNAGDYEPEVGVFSAGDYEPEMPFFSADEYEAQIQLFAALEQEQAIIRNNAVPDRLRYNAADHMAGFGVRRPAQEHANRLRYNAADHMARFGVRLPAQDHANRLRYNAPDHMAGFGVRLPAREHANRLRNTAAQEQAERIRLNAAQENANRLRYNNAAQEQAERQRFTATQDQADRLRNNAAQRQAPRNVMFNIPEADRPRSGEQREQEARRRQSQEARSDQVIRRVCKQCPQCRTNIEKDDGCNHMQCARCGIHFCWICLARLSGSDPYAHFQLGRCQMA